MTDPVAAEPELDARRRRTLYRARHRGMREMDIIVGGFAEARIARFDEAELAAFEALLEIPDDEMFGWLAGRTTVRPECDGPMWREIVAFQAAGGAVIPR